MDIEIPSRWTGQSVAELLAFEGQCEAWEITGLFDWALGIVKSDTRNGSLPERAVNLVRRVLRLVEWKFEYGKLTDTELIICAVSGVVRDVNNGGYEQFFGNLPQLTGTAVRAFETIECPETAQLTRHALDLVGLGHTANWKEVRKATQHLSKEIKTRLYEECDRPYYKLLEPHEDRLLEFIKLHKDNIRFPRYRG